MVQGNGAKKCFVCVKALKGDSLWCLLLWLAPLGLLVYLVIFNYHISLIREGQMQGFWENWEKRHQWVIKYLFRRQTVQVVELQVCNFVVWSTRD